MRRRAVIGRAKNSIRSSSSSAASPRQRRGTQYDVVETHRSAAPRRAGPGRAGLRPLSGAGPPGGRPVPRRRPGPSRSGAGSIRRRVEPICRSLLVTWLVRSSSFYRRHLFLHAEATLKRPFALSLLPLVRRRLWSQETRRYCCSDLHDTP